jgi:phage terminase large subunit-like protein
MYSPGGRRAGQDKISRANSVAPILESGMVWAPETQWADELIEECAAFPNGDNDDMVDSTTQALMRFRSGNFISLYDDEEDDEPSMEGLVPEYY